jgi:hypothetical protein
MIKQLVTILPASFAVIFSAYAAPQVTLSLDDIHSPVFSAKAIQVSLTGPQMSLLEVKLGEVDVQGKIWRNLRFSCHTFQFSQDFISCDDGILRLPKSAAVPAAFHFSSLNKTLDLNLRTTSNEGNEGWRLSARWGGAAWEGVLTVANGQIARIAELLPDIERKMLASAKGRVNGTAKVRGNAGGPAAIEANFAVEGLAFSDVSGLHAGENISGEITAKAMRQAGRQRSLWEWQADVTWPQGEVFWQPLYFTGQGHHLHVNGNLDDNIIRLLKGNLVLAGIGEVDLSGVVDRSINTVRDLDLRADNLELSTLFSQVLKPFLANTSFTGLKAAGHAGIQLRYRNSASELLTLSLRDVSVEDERERFAFRGVNANIPWQAQGVSVADISIQSSQLSRIPLGEFRVPLEINGQDLAIPRMTIPVLDGEFVLENFRASRQAQDWHWQFSGGLSPVSMQKLTEALKSRPMHGTLSGTIPKVSYTGNTLEMDGALLFKVFDGTVELRNMMVLDPMGRAPSLVADLAMRNLDLNLLTGVFSFGNMQGRVDVAVNGLELFDWKPIKFDASVMSSPGNYPRRISQAAVQNISSLGGSGAAAAIQRSFLHIFEEFGYSKIGWSCSLRNGICHMGGIESEHIPQGYVIVKGGGIPAITVIGYNRNVDWWELINRLQRITQKNVKPVFQ